MVVDQLKHRLVGQAPLNDCNDVMEKSKSAEIDHRHGTVIESPLSQNSTGSGPNQQYHPPAHSPNQSPRRRGHSIVNHRRRLCSVENIAYVIFFILLLVYISLQIMIATIHLDSGQTFTNEMDLDSGKTKNDSIHLNISDFNSFWSQVSKKTARLISNSVDMIPSTINNYVQRSEDGYILIFQILLAINVASLIPNLCSKVLLKWSQTQHHQTFENNDLKRRQTTHNKLLYRTYLPVYLLATCADWLQGPYKYALYSSYGYSQQDIAHLFVAGYGSGMFLGSIVGGLADQYGRKKLCLCYCLCYLFSVLMKHCKHFYMLLLGRVGGGIATSLLFSVFESWLIGAHIEKGLTDSNKGKCNDEEEKWLAKSFSYSTYGSSLVAISSGVLANLVVEHSGKMKPLPILGGNIYVGGYIAAFDACIVPLILCAALIMVFWDENYGVGFTSNTQKDEEIAEHVELVAKKRCDSGFAKKHSSVILDHDENVYIKENSAKSIQPNSAKVGLMSGVRTVWNSPTILTLCIIASTFEGSMYIFIFLWTPALTDIETLLRPTAPELPFGWIFASFMLCCLLGTISFSRLSSAGVSASKSLVAVLALGALSCLAMACPNISGSSGASSIQYWGMLCYEFAIGAYYPAMSVLKGTIVPEDQRATIYNVFRLPLNLLVLINLTTGISTQSSFYANATLLTVACALQIALVRGMSTTLR